MIKLNKKMTRLTNNNPKVKHAYKDVKSGPISSESINELIFAILTVLVHSLLQDLFDLFIRSIYLATSLG